MVPHHSGVKSPLSLCLDICQEKCGDMVRLTWMELNVKCPFGVFLPLFIYLIFSVNVIQFKMWVIKYEVNSQGSLSLRNQVIALVLRLALRWVHSSIYSFIHSLIKWVLSTYYSPEIVLGQGHIVMTETVTVPAIIGAKNLAGKTDII